MGAPVAPLKGTPSMLRGRGWLLLLVILFIVLAVITAVQTQQPVTVTPAGPELLRVFPALAATEIQAVRLRSPETGGEWIMARQPDGAWARPEGQPLGPELAAAVARTLVLLPYQRTVTPEGGDLTPFGFLPDGIFSIEFVLADGTAHAVVIGDLARSGDVYYAVVDDRPDVYFLERAAVDFLIAQYQARDFVPTPTP